MARRFYIRQYSASESTAYFDIEIWDSEFSGAALQVDGGFTLNYEGTDVDDIDKAIIASKANITLHIDSANDLEIFVNELSSASEERFTVRIYRNISLLWVGQILTDLVSFDDIHYSYDVSITAVCGLARLKNIDYDNDGNIYSGRNEIVDHIVQIISKLNLPLIDIHGFNSIVEILCNFKEDSCVFTGQSPLKFTDLDYMAFQEYDEYKVIKSDNCYDALDKILRTFRLRIFQTNGKFYVDQISSLTSQYFYGYRMDAGFVSASIIKSSVAVTSANRTAGSYRRLPPIRTITSEYEFKQGINRGNLLLPDITDDVNYDFGDIPGGSGERFIISGSFKLLIQENTSDDRLAFVRVAIMLKVGSYYLTGDLNSDDLSWSTTTTDVVYYTIGPFKQLDSLRDIPLSFITPVIPSSGNSDFMISVNRVQDDEGNLMSPDPGASFQIYAENNQLFLTLNYQDGASDGSQRIKSTNTTDGSTPIASQVIYELQKYTIGDGPRLFSAGRLKIYDGSNWVNSSSWSSVSGSSYSLAELRLRHIAANAKVTREIYDFTLLDGTYRPYNLLNYQSANWIMLSGTFDPDEDSWIISIMKLNSDHSLINVTTIEESTSAQSSSASGSSASGYSSANSHSRLHTVTNPLDHAPAIGTNKDKLLASNASTGALEWVSKVIQYFQRIGTTLSPATSGDSIDSGTGYLIGPLKATKVIAKSDGTTAIQTTKANGTSVIQNTDTTNEEVKLYAALALCRSLDTRPKSTLDVVGSLGWDARIYKPSAGGGSTTQQDSESTILIDCSLGNATLNLQSASAVPRRVLLIRLYSKLSTYTLTIDPYSSESLRGSVGSYNTLTVSTAGDWLIIQSMVVTSGYDWVIIASNNTL